MGFQHFPQFKKLFGVALIELLHAPLAAFFILNQIVTAKFEQIFPTTTGLTPAARASCSSEKDSPARSWRWLIMVKKACSKDGSARPAGADAVEAIVLRRFADNTPGAFRLDQDAAFAQMRQQVPHGCAADVIHFRQRVLCGQRGGIWPRAISSITWLITLWRKFCERLIVISCFFIIKNLFKTFLWAEFHNSARRFRFNSAFPDIWCNKKHGRMNNDHNEYLVCQEPKVMIWKKREIPMPGDDEALIKLKTVGICGTDIHAWGGNQPFLVIHEY
jgi:hypothetical protein